MGMHEGGQTGKNFDVENPLADKGLLKKRCEVVGDTKELGSTLRIIDR